MYVKIIVFSKIDDINLLGDNVFNYMLQLVVKNHYLSEIVYNKNNDSFHIVTKHNDGNNGVDPHSTYKTIPHSKIKLLERKDKILKLSNNCNSSN